MLRELRELGWKRGDYPAGVPQGVFGAEAEADLQILLYGDPDVPEPVGYLRSLKGEVIES